MGELLSESMGGTSGALYGLLFSGAANSMLAEERRRSRLNKKDVKLRKGISWDDKDMKDVVQVWIDAFEAGIFNIRKYGGAKGGDRTMVTCRTSFFT
jgi:hypothetical protein